MRGERERRTEKSWSFCSYFLLQEELAQVFTLLALHDEALVQYDELDALFTQFVLNSAAGGNVTLPYSLIFPPSVGSLDRKQSSTKSLVFIWSLCSWFLAFYFTRLRVVQKYDDSPQSHPLCCMDNKFKVLL